MALQFRPNVTGSADEYQVLHGNWQIGQIIKRISALDPKRQWLWALNGVPDGPDNMSRTGFSESLDAAKAEFTDCWERWLGWAGFAQVSDRR
jgi:hypothetical protein